MAIAREKFATQVDSTLLTELRSLAQTEGRQMQVLIEEAISDLLEKRKNASPRTHVLKAYQTSHSRYAKVYEHLAK